MSVVTGLSSYHIRGHHIMYSQAIRFISAADFEFDAVDNFAHTDRIFFPWKVWKKSTSFVGNEYGYATTTMS